jgi:hypothetical protein
VTTSRRKNAHSVAHAHTNVWMSDEVAAGWTTPIVNQMPTPEIAPKTVERRRRIVDDRFTRSRSGRSFLLTAAPSRTAMTSPPPTAKWETTTCRIATTAIRTPPPAANSLIG